jgi:hypothetical protein
VSEAYLVLPNGAHHPLSDELRVGRDPANDLVVPTKSVSREHAAILAVSGRWFVEDRGSYNGTRLNGERIRPGAPLPLRDADRLTIGPLTLVFRSPANASDDEATKSFEDALEPLTRPLSPLQRRVVGLLCRAWLDQGERGQPPTNKELAAALGTPGAVDAVKAALRRAYAKAGIGDLPPHEKRRLLCQVARRRGWT